MTSSSIAVGQLTTTPFFHGGHSKTSHTLSFSPTVSPIIKTVASPYAHPIKMPRMPNKSFSTQLAARDFLAIQTTMAW